MNDTPVILNLQNCTYAEQMDLISQILNNQKFGHSIEDLFNKPFKTLVFIKSDTPNSSFSERYLGSLNDFVKDFIFSPKNTRMIGDGTTIEFLCEKIISGMTLIHFVSVIAFLFEENYLKKQNWSIADRDNQLKFKSPVISGYDYFMTELPVLRKTILTKYALMFGFESCSNTDNIIIEMDIFTSKRSTLWQLNRNIKDKSLAADLTNNVKQILDKYYDANK